VHKNHRLFAATAAAAAAGATKVTVIVIIVGSVARSPVADRIEEQRESIAVAC